MVLQVRCSALAGLATPAHGILTWFADGGAEVQIGHVACLGPPSYVEHLRLPA